MGSAVNDTIYGRIENMRIAISTLVVIGGISLWVDKDDQGQAGLSLKICRGSHNTAFKVSRCTGTAIEP